MTTLKLRRLHETYLILVWCIVQNFAFKSKNVFSNLTFIHISDCFTMSSSQFLVCWKLIPCIFKIATSCTFSYNRVLCHFSLLANKKIIQSMYIENTYLTDSLWHLKPGGADPRDDDVRGKAIVVDTVWSFEPVKRSWFSEGSLNIPRKNFGLIVHRNHLLAIGGQDRQYK